MPTVIPLPFYTPVLKADELKRALAMHADWAFGNDHRTPRGETALIAFTRAGNSACVQHLLDRQRLFPKEHKDHPHRRLDLYATDQHGHNAFYYAATSGSNALCAILIQANNNSVVEAGGGAGGDRNTIRAREQKDNFVNAKLIRATLQAGLSGTDITETLQQLLDNYHASRPSRDHLRQECARVAAKKDHVAIANALIQPDECVTAFKHAGPKVRAELVRRYPDQRSAFAAAVNLDPDGLPFLIHIGDIEAIRTTTVHWSDIPGFDITHAEHPDSIEQRRGDGATSMMQVVSADLTQATKQEIIPLLRPFSDIFSATDHEGNTTLDIASQHCRAVLPTLLGSTDILEDAKPATTMQETQATMILAHRHADGHTTLTRAALEGDLNAIKRQVQIYEAAGFTNPLLDPRLASAHGQMLCMWALVGMKNAADSKRSSYEQLLNYFLEQGVPVIALPPPSTKPLPNIQMTRYFEYRQRYLQKHNLAGRRILTPHLFALQLDYAAFGEKALRSPARLVIVERIQGSYSEAGRPRYQEADPKEGKKEGKYAAILQPSTDWPIYFGQFVSYKKLPLFEQWQHPSTLIIHLQHIPHFASAITILYQHHPEHRQNILNALVLSNDPQYCQQFMIYQDHAEIDFSSPLQKLCSDRGNENINRMLTYLLQTENIHLEPSEIVQALIAAGQHNNTVCVAIFFAHAEHCFTDEAIAQILASPATDSVKACVVARTACAALPQDTEKDWDKSALIAELVARKGWKRDIVKQRLTAIQQHIEAASNRLDALTRLCDMPHNRRKGHFFDVTEDHKLMGILITHLLPDVPRDRLSSEPFVMGITKALSQLIRQQATRPAASAPKREAPTAPTTEPAAVASTTKPSAPPLDQDPPAEVGLKSDEVNSDSDREHSTTPPSRSGPKSPVSMCTTSDSYSSDDEVVAGFRSLPIPWSTSFQDALDKLRDAAISEAKARSNCPPTA